MTLQQLGDRVGIKRQQIQKYETGTCPISASRMWDIAAAMTVPVSFFFEWLDGRAGNTGEAHGDKRSVQAKSFKVIPRRWVVERTIAWINRCRRLAKDYENLNRTAIAFIRLASIRLMLRRLTRYCYPS